MSALAATISVGAFLYALLGLLVTTAWWRLLGAADQRPPWVVGLVIFGTSQWAKYLPSNTLHFVGRQVLGRRYGIHQANLAVASTFETLSLVAAAALVAGSGLWLEGDLEPEQVVTMLVGVGAVALLLFVLEGALRGMRWTAGLMKNVPSLHDVATYQRLAASVGLHSIFFVAVGVIGWLLSITLFPTESSSVGGAAGESIYRVLWVFASAWLAGTLTIGAPAGAGVREGVLVLGLSPSLGGTAAVTVAIILRVITVLGDGLVALIALFVERKANAALAHEKNDPPQ